jgi:uncharacterized SAM-binding protein YcdF (DUF218 family)
MKCLVLGLLLAGCVDGRDLFTPYAPNDADVRAVLAAPWPLASFDVAIVLGCPANPDAQLSLCQACRVHAAVDVFERRVARNLLFSGADAHSPDIEAVVMANAAIARGVPDDRIARETTALTTWQNLRYSRRIARSHAWRDVLIVSTADHLPRARRIARHFGYDDAHTAYLACDR